MNAIALSGRTALFRCRRYRVLSSGREETSVLPANAFVSRTDSRIWVGGGKNEVVRFSWQRKEKQETDEKQKENASFRHIYICSINILIE